MPDNAPSLEAEKELNAEDLSAVAHELVAPLTAVIGYAEMLESREAPAGLADQLRHLAAQARYCRAVSRALLGLTPAAPRRPADLSAVLKGAAALVLAPNQTEGKLNLDCPPGLWVLGEAALLECAFSNLFRNALATAQGVKVTARPAGDGIQVDVTDDGPGVPEKLRDNLFERGVSGRGGARSSGLGLWLVRRVLRSSGGSVELASSGPGGSTFRVKLPAAPAPEETTAQTEGESAVRPALRVLVVEDDPGVAEVLADSLRLLGHEPVAVAGPDRARAELERGEFDALTLDLHLGAAGGMDFYREVLRRWPALARRTVFSTAAPLNGEAAQVPGPDPVVLRKPFGLGELRLSLEEAAGR